MAGARLRCAPPRQVDAFPKVRHGAVDAQQLIVAAQPLTLCVDQQQDRAARMLRHGVENYLAMGGVASVWQGDLAECLRRALAQASTEDRRARDGAERGGRRLASATVQAVLDAA